MSRTRRLSLVLGLVVLLVAAATSCGDDDDDSDASDTTQTSAAAATTAPATTGGGAEATTTSGAAATTTTAVELTDSFRGVTAEAIKVGVVMVDYDGCIKDFIDFTRGDQQAAYEALIDDINAQGGVLGRTLEPVYKTYCPIGSTDPLAKCVELTEDDEVFAVIGVFIDFSGDAQLCLTRDHETIHIGHELEQAWIDEAPPGLLLTNDVTAERSFEVLMDVLVAEGTLEGKTVAVLASSSTSTRAEGAIVPRLEEEGIDQGSLAVLAIAGEDTSAAQAQLDGFIERWRGEGVDTVIISGQEAGARQFVEKIRTELPGIQLIADAPSGVLVEGRDFVAQGITPNPYEGTIAVEPSLTGDPQFEEAGSQACVDAFEKATGTTVLPPSQFATNAAGKREEVYIAVRDACTELSVFTQIAEKAGGDLTNESWTEAVNTFGAIEIPAQEFSSYKEGKYYANDAFKLVQFSSTAVEGGGWEAISDVVNTAQ
jgi:hypothetical protein